MNCLYFIPKDLNNSGIYNGQRLNDLFSVLIFVAKQKRDSMDKVQQYLKIRDYFPFRPVLAMSTNAAKT